MHHTAIRVSDVEQSLRFWSEGIGSRECSWTTSSSSEGDSQSSSSVRL